MLIICCLLLAAVAFAAILLLRALRFTPPEATPAADDGLTVDAGRAVGHLQALVRCKTISEPTLRDEAEFERFRALLPEFYPTLWAAAEIRQVDTTGVLIRVPGNEAGDPAVLLGHYDVVPVNETQWDKPAFEGILENGVLWGRGTLDMKNQLTCMLEAMEQLLAEGFTPKHDIWFALSGEEEIMGSSAPSMRDVLKQAEIRPAFVLDEGGDIMEGFFPGADVACAMIGIGEKGAANIDFIATGPGGHSSVPAKDNPLSRLCAAMAKLEKHPWPMHPGKALDLMVDTMGRYCCLKTRLLLANRHILKPLYYRWLKKQGGMLEAAARTTFALTRASGSTAGNVIPPNAEMFANLRLLDGDTHASVIARMQQLVGPNIIIRDHALGSEACPDAAMTAGYEEICSAIHATWPHAVVSPYQMVACTDSRHWCEICDNVYRFSAKEVTSAEKATVHGNNERIRIENTENACKFFIRLLRQC